jgi:hypothetical protein
MNIFNFDYEIHNLTNKDNTPSRFNVVYGNNGNIVHTKKQGYTLVKTEDLSNLADTFISRGYKVNPFHHRDGEIIGLNIDYKQNKMTCIGEKQYSAIINIPNNGGGSGYLSILEKRLICLNGQTRTAKVGENKIRIPHVLNYPAYLKIMEDAIIAFEDIIISIETTDNKLNDQKLDDLQARYELNKWFFNNELPLNEKKLIGTLDKFREMLALNPEDIENIERYNQLMLAYNKELEHNKTLNLDLSMYTVLASCTNYLSRRIERSKSTAPKEIKFQREAKKLESILN